MLTTATELLFCRTVNQTVISANIEYIVVTAN